MGKQRQDLPHAFPNCCFGIGNVSTIRLRQQHCTARVSIACRDTSAYLPTLIEKSTAYMLPTATIIVHRDFCRKSASTHHVTMVPYGFWMWIELFHNLRRPSHHEKTECHHEGAADHEGPPAAPFRSRVVGEYTHDRLHDQSRKGSSDPHGRHATF